MGRIMTLIRLSSEDLGKGNWLRVLTMTTGNMSAWVASAHRIIRYLTGQIQMAFVTRLLFHYRGNGPPYLIPASGGR